MTPPFSLRQRKKETPAFTPFLDDYAGKINEEVNNESTEDPAGVELEGSKPMLGTNLLKSDVLLRLSTNRRYSVKSVNDEWTLIEEGDANTPATAGEIKELTELQKKNELQVMNILSIISGLVFILWVVTVALTKVYLGWATLLAALTIMITHAVAVKW